MAQRSNAETKRGEKERKERAEKKEEHARPLVGTVRRFIGKWARSRLALKRKGNAVDLLV